VTPVYLTHSDIADMIGNLTRQILDSKRRFHQVVGIANGGLPVSRPLAAALALPHTSVRISHYNKDLPRDTPIVKGKLIQPTNNLIVDELIDRGWTYNTFDEHFGLEGNAMAVLLWNPNGPKPDFYVAEKPNAWVVFPWEKEFAECELKST
jgi:hypoxanthine phosphoribosyltransferase